MAKPIQPAPTLKMSSGVDRAKAQSREWSVDFVHLMCRSGLDNWSDRDSKHGWKRWDALPPERKKELEAIYTAGFDNITFEKVGIPRLDDEGMIAHAKRWP